MPEDDKNIRLLWKKIFVILYFIFINKDKESFSLSLFNKDKD
jgi:hypothetical protein